MIRYKTYFTVAILLIAVSANCLSQVFRKGEKLSYEVYFWGMALGKVVVSSEGNYYLDDKKTSKIKVSIDTYNGIPFVDHHSYYYSWSDVSLKYSHVFHGYRQNEDKQTELFATNLEYDKNRIRFNKYIDSKIVSRDTIQSGTKRHDGIGMIFYARKMCSSNGSYKIPTIKGRDTVYTTFVCNNKINEAVEIDKFDKEIDTYKLTIKAGWKGVYGLSGVFECWFSRDDARIPLKAVMGVYVGSVTIELTDYHRPGWKPPFSKTK